MSDDLTALTEALARRISSTPDLARAKAEAYIAEHVAPLIAEREAKARREGAAEAYRDAAERMERGCWQPGKRGPFLRELAASAVSGEPT